MKRHPELSIRTPEGCSLARASAFNKHSVNTFYDKLEECLRRHPSFADGSRVGNLDETSTSTVQNMRRIISPKGVKQVHKVKSAERGVSVTTCCLATAFGSIIPPVMIFPRKKFVSNMLLNAFPGTLGLANENGYMTKETFVSVIHHLIKHTAASKGNPFLLLIDNVESHLSVEALSAAKENGITLLTFPPHCTHKLQPLDLSLFGPFKTHYDSALSSWLLQHPGQSVSIYHIAGFVKTALTKAGTVENIAYGFAKAGILPFDRNLFSDADFLMSSVTEKPDPNNVIEVIKIVPIDEPSTSSPIDIENVIDLDISSPSKIIDVDISVPETSTTPKKRRRIPKGKAVQRNSNVAEKPGPSGEVEALTSAPMIKPTTNPSSGSETLVQETTSVSASSSFISPKEFRGLPKVKGTGATSRKPRRKGKCFIPTDTPEKNEIEERQRARDEQKRKTEENKRKRAEKKQLAEAEKIKKPKVSRVLNFNEESDPDGDLEPEKTQAVQKNKAAKKIKSGKKNTSTSRTVKKSTAKDSCPVEGDFALVLFTSRANKHYVGKIIKDVNQDGNLEISCLRLATKSKDRFVLPQQPDLCSIHRNDIKGILPPPTSHPGSTKRQPSLLGFDFDFRNLKLG